MEDQFEEVVFSLVNQSAANLRYRYLLIQRLTDPLGSDVYHYRVSQEGYGGTCGTGTDLAPQLALKKAFAEYCERSVIMKSGSNGFACHHSQQLAQLSAYYEIIERDLVLSSWMAKLPPTWLTRVQLSEISGLKSLLKIFQQHGLKVSIGIVGICNNIVVGVGTLQTLPGSKLHFFNLLASAAGENITQVVEKLLLDLRRSIGFLYISEGEKQIQCNQIKSPFDHIKYYAFNAQSKAEFDWYYGQSQDQNVRIFDDVGDVKYIEHPNPYFDDVPYYIYQAVPASGTFQDYFAGIPNAQKINFNRLRQMGIKDLSSINSSPHPLG